MIWTAAQRVASHRHLRDAGWLRWLLVATLLLWLGACAPLSADGHAPTAAPAATRTAAEALARMKNITPGSFILFASITFTADTTYDEATAILRGHVYPWTCDDPREPTPPSVADQRASFAAAHTLLMSYPTWDELMHIASSPQVVSVENAPLYQCS